MKTSEESFNNYDCVDCTDCSASYDCYACKDCKDCSDCEYCLACKDCYGCRYCKDCKDCKGCISCVGCEDCRFSKNLTFEELHLFCCYMEVKESTGLNNPYRAFNKEVGKIRYNELVKIVDDIIPEPQTLEDITQDQLQQLLAIPEAVGFEKGFEFISGVNYKYSL